jgi:hypothetical protein
MGSGFDRGAYEFGGTAPPPPPPPTQDTTPPNPPTNFKEATPAACTTACEMPMTWTAATDNVGVTGYDDYNDGVLVGHVSGSTTSASWGGSGYGTCETHTIGLVAIDAAGNRSTMATASAKTYCAQTTSLEIKNLRRDPATDLDSQAGLVWFAWDTPSAAFTSYNLYVDGQAWWEHPSTDATRWWVGSPNWACGSSHTISIEAVNGSTVGPRASATLTNRACA